MSRRLSGRIASVNVSHGGVPKRPIPGGWVDRLGLEADAHEEPPPMHGGVDQAISIYSVESIARVVADGHRSFPGAFGENLTLDGIELDEMRPGDRVRIGDGGLVLELTKRAEPCQTIAHWFVARRISRIASKLNPRDARWYARVVAEGPVRAGDRVGVDSGR
ncbi:MAG TPA: MOSC domain-containing protein [Candidatus Limnocylindrales bacterium]|nr:MOSC domain-containing protein [Candidatus Limnocylindrales bacterium]